MSSKHWIQFWVRGTVRNQAVDEMVTVYLVRPCALYDPNLHGGYVAGRARALRRAKQRCGIHTSTSNKLFRIDPHDWSDSIDTASAA